MLGSHIRTPRLATALAACLDPNGEAVGTAAEALVSGTNFIWFDAIVDDLTPPVSLKATPGPTTGSQNASTYQPRASWPTVSTTGSTQRCTARRSRSTRVSRGRAAISPLCVSSQRRPSIRMHLAWRRT